MVRQQELNHAVDRLQRATELFEKKPSAALADAVRVLEERVKEAREAAELAAMVAAQADRTVTARRAKALWPALKRGELAQVNAALRQMLQKAELHPKGDLQLFWRDGTVSRWQVGSPF